jgi:4-amino-4-deoxy-L-arabinose transferase-like glycosyltransferase
MRFVLKDKFLPLLVALIAGVILYKFRYLSLPYYWDEAWPYSKAVYLMYVHGPSLLPNSIAPFVSRGHPLMFHFLAAIWMNIFGTGLISGHSFALAISIFVIIVSYIFCKKFFSPQVGIVAAILLAFQPVFIAQSAFLLPEMMVALWTMLCFYFYFSNRKALFIVIASVLLLTKESGLVVLCTLGAYTVFQFVREKEKNSQSLIKSLLLVVTPVLIASTFFIAQKILCSFFLFPLYTSYIRDQWMSFTDTLPNAAAYLFIYDGRNGLSFFILASCVLLVTRRKGLTDLERKIILCFGLFLSFFLAFSSVNFYIPRYLSCAFPPLMIVASVVIVKAFRKAPAVVCLIVAGLAVTHVYYYRQIKDAGDIDYFDTLVAHQQAVHYLEQKKLNDRYILTSVIKIALEEPCAGYLSSKPFSHIQASFDDHTEYCVATSDDDQHQMYDQIMQRHKLVLLQRFGNRRGWSEIYQVVK